MNIDLLWSEVDYRYAYPVAYVRALEMKLLDKEWIEKLIETTDSTELIRVIREGSPLSDSFSNVMQAVDFENALTKELDKTLSILEKLCPEPELITLFRLKYDFYNLATVLKEYFLKQTIKNKEALIDLGTIKVARLMEIINENQISELPKPLREMYFSIYKIYSEKENLRIISLLVEKRLYSYLLEVSTNYKKVFLVDFFKTLIDLTNLKTFFRIKLFPVSKDILADLSFILIKDGKIPTDFFIENIETPLEVFIKNFSFTIYTSIAETLPKNWDIFSACDSFATIEKICDNFILDYLENTKFSFFNIAPLVNFLVRKEIEIKTLRTIFLGKINGIPTEEIKKSLRKPYI